MHENGCEVVQITENYSKWGMSKRWNPYLGSPQKAIFLGFPSLRISKQDVLRNFKGLSKAF